MNSFKEKSGLMPVLKTKQPGERWLLEPCESSTWSNVGKTSEQIKQKRAVKLKHDKRQHIVSRRNWYLKIIIEKEAIYYTVLTQSSKWRLWQQAE